MTAVPALLHSAPQHAKTMDPSQLQSRSGRRDKQHSSTGAETEHVCGKNTALLLYQ